MSVVMSQGHEGTAEPDLVPLLDVVLQLVMFFILTANFVMEDVDREIDLPEATQAKSFDAKDSNLRFVSVRSNGVVRFGYPMPVDRALAYNADALNAGRNALNENEIRTRFEEMYKIEKANLPPGEDQVTNPIAIRADESTKFQNIYTVMKWARNAGFKELRLRVIKRAAE